MMTQHPTLPGLAADSLTVGEIVDQVCADYSSTHEPAVEGDYLGKYRPATWGERLACAVDRMRTMDDRIDPVMFYGCAPETVVARLVYEGKAGHQSRFAARIRAAAQQFSDSQRK